MSQLKSIFNLVNIQNTFACPIDLNGSGINRFLSLSLSTTHIYRYYVAEILIFLASIAGKGMTGIREIVKKYK